MPRRTISELADIDFSGSIGEDMKEYGDRLHALGVRWSFEFEIATVDAEAAMASLSGKWWLVGLDTKYKARKVSRRLKRMQEMAHGMGDQGSKFHRTYLRHFPEAAK